MFEFLNIAALLCSLGYSNCEEPTPPPVIHPEQGTVIEAYCDGTTFVEVIADGNGNNNEFREEQSEQCGYEPPPPEYGTLLREGCSQEYPGVKWFQYADGEGGTYVEKDRFSWECGYRRILTLTLDQEVGDRFNPIVVDVDYVNNRGEIEGWGMNHSSTTIGYAERVAFNKVHIYGDGRVGDGIFTLGTQEIQYRIDPEPKCIVNNRVDCQGYRQSVPESYFYYGEDDTKIVTWELGILLYESVPDDDYHYEGEIRQELTPLDPEWEKWEKRVKRYNEVYVKSGVFIKYKLTYLAKSHYHSLEQLKKMSYDIPVDIILAHGTSYTDTCGVAKVTTYFREGKPPVSMSKCDIYTDLHELGHSVGLAHGPNNIAYEANGYIFPDFGHGEYDVCGINDDLMSYGSQGYFHTNETLYCSEIFDRDTGQVAGGRQWSDTAYSLNRVRYNVSLIHDSNKYDDELKGLQRISVEAEHKEIEVID